MAQFPCSCVRSVLVFGREQCGPVLWCLGGTIRLLRVLGGLLGSFLSLLGRFLVGFAGFLLLPGLFRLPEPGLHLDPLVGIAVLAILDLNRRVWHELDADRQLV